jgi:hypothetical protein
MVIREATPAAGEESSLLRDDDGSSGTLRGSQQGDEELADPDKANQYVGTGRGVLICLSVWGLIFLQGMKNGSLLLQLVGVKWNYGNMMVLM